MAFADNVVHYLEIRGLEVPDEIRVLPLEAQSQALAAISNVGNNSKKPRRCKNWIRVVGWSSFASRSKANVDKLEPKM